MGRIESTGMDNFTLTRNLNHPELMFNQRPGIDHDFNKKYFWVDAGGAWQLSTKNQCMICDKYQYTQIHYERGLIAKNKDLTEIHDPAILKELKYAFNK